MKNRSGEKIKLISIDELLGVVNEEYEMVFGHRRMHAAQLAGLTTIPAIVRELSNDDAIVAMVDANIQRHKHHIHGEEARCKRCFHILCHNPYTVC